MLENVNNTISGIASGSILERERTISMGSVKPNVVKIQTLDADATSRYYRGINNVRGIARNLTSSAQTMVFYGLLSPDYELGYQLNLGWGDSSLFTYKDMVKIANDYNAPLPGASTQQDLVTGEAAGQLSKAQSMARNLTGANANIIGGVTQKAFNKFDINDFRIEMKWNLQEQLAMYMDNITVLHQMIYPTVPGFRYEIPTMKKKTTLNGSGNTKPIGSNTRQSAVLNNESVVSGLPVVGPVLSQLPPLRMADGVINVLSDATSGLLKLGETLDQGLTTYAEGKTLAKEPVPVRLLIGNVIDLEPLVLTSVDIKYSKQTFIVEPSMLHDGDPSRKALLNKQIPIEAHVTVSAKMWLVPQPDIQFMKVLGKEIFGVGQ